MTLLVLAGLNNSLTQAKILPLLKTDWVTKIIWVSGQPGPENPAVQYVKVPFKGSFSRTIAMLAMVIKLVLQSKPDLIMAYNLVPYSLIAYLVSRLFTIPLGINVLGGRLEIEGGGILTGNRITSKIKYPNRPLERLLLFLLRSSDFVTTTGTRTKQYLQENGVPAARIFPISSVISPADYYPQERPRRYQIVCVSALIPLKRIDWLISLTAELKKQFRDLKVAILGDGPLLGPLSEQVQELGLENQVDFLGFQADVREVLWSSQLFVITSFTEGLPLSLMEAMACGLPPVVSDVGDVTDLVKDKINGRIIPVADFELFKEAIHEMLKNEDLRREMGNNAIAAVKKGYLIDTATNKWNEVYHTILTRKTRCAV